MEKLSFYFVLFSTLVYELLSRDPVADQLQIYKTMHNKESNIVTSFGAPIPNKDAVLTAGPRGPVLLQDIVFVDELAHFVREVIPERRGHAKGSGAFGYFQITNDITKYTKASVFTHIGKVTRVAVRMSTISGERGSADTVREARGFAVKFYTEDGIWDLVGLNIPVFLLRDPLLFPSLMHVLKRNPVTNTADLDMFWDFVTLRPETMNGLLRLMAPEGIPDGYRHMNGYGVHTFRLVSKEGNVVYAKFHFKTEQGFKNINSATAATLRGIKPDYSGSDLYNAISRRLFPAWRFSIQVMTIAQAEKFRWNPFDATKLWPEQEFPLIPVGRLVLDRNPVNYFTDVEQIGFSVAHMIPGIEPSPDKVLQGRLFAYSDALRYRLGPNHLQLPVNCPFQSTNYQRDGQQAFRQDGAPNYHPNSFSGQKDVPSAAAPIFRIVGDVARYNSSEEDNYSQPIMYVRSLTNNDRAILMQNVAEQLKLVTGFIQNRAVKMFINLDKELGLWLAKELRR